MTTRSKYIGGVLQFHDDGQAFEVVHRMSALQYRDDFLGAGSLVIPAAGAAESGVDWVKKIVGAAPPTVAGVANGAGGQIACTLTATSEKQGALAYWNDQKSIDVTKGAVFEARVQLSVLPSVAGVQAIFGLASNWIDGPDNNTCYLEMGANGSGALLIRSFDGVTTKSVAAGITLLATDWAVIRIDATDPTDVKFVVNGTQVSTTGLVNFAATGSLAVLQPHFQMYKPSGTGVGTLTVDEVKVWANRQ